MKIGILCEGEKTDVPVLNSLLGHLFSKVTFEIRGVSKAVIFDIGDLELQKIFDKGVDRALIVWDLLPTGHKMGVPAQWSGDPNRSEQRKKLLQLLHQSSKLSQPLRQQALYLAYRYGFYPESEVRYHPNKGDDLFKLVCVCYMCDGWLLADGSVLRDFASSRNRKPPHWTPPHPDMCEDPTGELKKYFKQSPHKRYRYYNKIDHNKEIARAYIQHDKVSAMETSASFSRIVRAVKQWSGT